ncbi:hypothetical protein BU17DRAFT_65990 [Hysterangium stoloniferum]|nr:hypothetical protein BU17DRAFT_65990 [Hysterangium stoloniferum]
MIINFGFTKQFEHRSNHLMGGHAVHHATRNLSSRGLDVGSAVDCATSSGCSHQTQDDKRVCMRSWFILWCPATYVLSVRSKRRCSWSNQSRRGALLPPSLPLFHFTGPSGLQRKDHAETIEDIREKPREREGESRTKRHIIQLEYPEGAQKEKEKETGADATRQEGTGILLNSDIRGRIAVAPKRISTNPPSLPLDEITPPRRAIFSNAAAFNVSIEGRDVVHALQPPRRYNSPSLLQRSDWLSQCSTGSVGADCVTDFVMETVALRR